MTPIEPRAIVSERSQKIQSEITAYLSADVPCAEVWKDPNVNTQRSVELYNRELRRMQLTDIDVCQRRSKVIIKKKGVIV